eukprot:765280-Hanusia_phi.AAC.2
MLWTPDAELEMCKYCSKAFHRVCAAEIRGADNVHFCGDCRRDEVIDSWYPNPPASTAIPGHNTSRSGSSILDLFEDRDAPGPSHVADRNVESVNNLEGKE